MNTMLGMPDEPLTGPWRTSLIVGYHAAMAVPVCNLDELQLGRFWSQGPSDEMLDVLIPTTIEHLRDDLFSAYGTPTFTFLARAGHYVKRPQHEPALCALIEAWAPRLVEVLRDAEQRVPTEREVADAALEAAQRYPSALFAFENAYRAAGDHAGVASILALRAQRAATAAERVALLVDRARMFEDNLDLEEAQYAWLELLLEVPERACDEVMRLFALDPSPPWRFFIERLRDVALATPLLRDALRRQATDLAAAKLDDPELARAVIEALRR